MKGESMSWYKFKTIFKTRKYFTFFGNLKNPKEFNKLFDKNGVVFDEVYTEASNHNWHFSGESYGAMIVILSDIKDEVKKYLRIPEVLK